jgi:hypothetical protein
MYWHFRYFNRYYYIQIGTTMDFIIEKAIPAEKAPKDIYRLHVVGMSGDADHYETNTRDFSDMQEPKMRKIIAIMIAGFQTHCLYNDKLQDEAIEKAAEGTDIKYPTDVYTDMVGYDITNDGQTRCSPDEMYVTWFNCFGTEHKVAIELDNGVVVDKITEYNVKGL